MQIFLCPIHVSFVIRTSIDRNSPSLKILSLNASSSFRKRSSSTSALSNSRSRQSCDDDVMVIGIQREEGGKWCEERERQRVRVRESIPIVGISPRKFHLPMAWLFLSSSHKVFGASRQVVCVGLEIIPLFPKEDVVAQRCPSAQGTCGCW